MQEILRVLLPCTKPARNHNWTSIHTLAELGANIDAVTLSCRSPLHSVISNHYTFDVYNTLYLLLALGANVSLSERNFCSTACHVAATKGLFDVVAALMAAGSDIDQPNSSGHTPRTILLQNHKHIPSDADVESARKKNCKTASRSSAESRLYDLHCSTITSTTCSANVRNSDAYEHVFLAHRVSPVVGDCNYRKALFQTLLIHYLNHLFESFISY
jgi:hypothetical protein